MGEMERDSVGIILDRFVEGLFRLMLDHHRAHVVEMDLTVVQAQTLTLLRGESLPTTRLASFLGISAPAMTQLTDRLVRKRLIERRAADGDRRTVIIELTTQGTRVVDRFRKRRSEVFMEALTRLDDLDREEVMDALGKVVVALEGHSGRSDIRAEEPIRSRHFSGHFEKQTAARPAEASKKVGEIPTNPPVRRMRIEWD